MLQCGPGPREECFHAVPAIGRSVSARPQANVLRSRPQAGAFQCGPGGAVGVCQCGPGPWYIGVETGAFECM